MLYRNTYKKLYALVFACIFFTSPGTAHASSVQVYIPEKYVNVQAGERLYFELDALYPENPSRRDFKIAYRIMGGNTEIASSEFIKAIETQASFVDYIVIPKTAKKGLYTIQVSVTALGDGPALMAGASASFHLESDFNWMALYASILFAAIAVIGIVLSLQIRSLRRNIRMWRD